MVGKHHRVSRSGRRYAPAWTVRPTARPPPQTSGPRALSRPGGRRTSTPDVTGDGQPEIIASHCTGFGNRCFREAWIWLADGRQILDAQFDRFGGIQFLRSTNTIVTLSPVAIVGEAEAGKHPTEWRLDYYRWDGTALAKIDTQLQPYAPGEFPAIPNQPTATPCAP
jgi:hypothetical protein